MKKNCPHQEAQREKIKDEIVIKEKFELTPKQQEIIKVGTSLRNTRCLILDGIAGTSKTYTSVLIALRLLNSRRISEISYIRTLVQSKDGETGFLTGSLEEKTQYYNVPFFDKLEELLTKPDIDQLTKENRIHTYPSSMLRGIQLGSVTIFDEVQNALFSTIETVMTRMQEHSLLILCGDASGSQNDLGQRSGFAKVCQAFNDHVAQEHGIFYFKLGVEDIVRSKFVRFVAERFEQLKNK